MELALCCILSDTLVSSLVSVTVKAVDTSGWMMWSVPALKSPMMSVNMLAGEFRTAFMLKTSPFRALLASKINTQVGRKHHCALSWLFSAIGMSYYRLSLSVRL